MAEVLEKEVFSSINPSTGEIIGHFNKMTKEQVVEKIKLATDVNKKWKNTPAPVRGEWLLKLSVALQNHLDELANLVTKEVGKCIQDGVNEVTRSISMLKFFAGEGYRLTGDTIPSANPNILVYTKQQPLGTVGIITPWNVPLAIPIWKMAPALVAGNTIVWKPAEQSLLTSQKLMEILEEIEFPKDVIQMVVADGPIVGEAFAECEEIKAVSFTGSTKTGRIIHNQLAPRAIRFQAEMGGKNPFIIMPDADIELATDDIIAGGLLDAGQRCTATSRIFIHTSIYENLKTILVPKINALVLGPPTDISSNIGPVVDANQYSSILNFIKEAKAEGATIIAGEDGVEEEWAKNGYYVRPTLFDNVNQSMKIAQQEVFGPVLVLIPFDNLEDCLKQANDIEYGLSSTIYTKDLATAMKYADEIESGLVHINIPSTYSEPQMPFGGIKATGIGGFREQGSHAVKFYTEWKTVYVRTT